jgi:gliding motility-associated-like protein
LPVVLFKADTLNGCSPLCVNFADMTTIPSGTLSTWAWTFGDDSTSNKQNPNHCYTNPGIYSVGLTVTSDSGCTANLNVANMINVYSHPVAAFTASPQPATILEPTVQFTDKSTDNYGIVSWQWVFNDPADGTSTLENPAYTYTDTGTYCAQLVVINKFGCTDTITQCEIIQPFFTLYIPNAFTPNGDGLNDIFQVKGNFICGFQMYIFDRWGMQLYYTEDINKGWDGTVNGGSNIVQEDSYVYLINAIDCISHAKHQYLGKITVVK